MNNIVLANSLFVLSKTYIILSHVQLLATPWTVALQASLSVDFSR